MILSAECLVNTSDNLLIQGHFRCSFCIWQSFYSVHQMQRASWWTRSILHSKCFLCKTKRATNIILWRICLLGWKHEHKWEGYRSGKAMVHVLDETRTARVTEFMSLYMCITDGSVDWVWMLQNYCRINMYCCTTCIYCIRVLWIRGRGSMSLLLKIIAVVCMPLGRNFVHYGNVVTSCLAPTPPPLPYRTAPSLTFFTPLRS